ncbi:MAG: molybdate ABC transporter substrate-binding protein [Spirochaetia bacterium]|nr:molybdate ABC transporter substrate-binding protein [Spirochaetia bacterium]
MKNIYFSKRFIFRLIILFYVFAVNITCKKSSVDDASSEKITLAVAANAQYALSEIIAAFEKKYSVKPQMTVSSSGKLTAQIIHGAPFDIFLSADMKYPQTLYEKKYSDKPPDVYAYGSLILWTQKKEILPDSLKKLSALKFDKIAVANPRNAPYGEQAVYALKNAGIYGALRKKIVYGESVSQTNHYILSGSVDIGITAKSTLFSPIIEKKKYIRDVETNLYEPIKQGVIKLKRANTNKTANEFYAFLFSDEAKKILRDFGYLTP